MFKRTGKQSAILETVTDTLIVVASVGIVCALLILLKYQIDDRTTERQIAALQEQLRLSREQAAREAAALTAAVEETEQIEEAEQEESAPAEPAMLPEYAALYEQNEDIVGWLRIDGTRIDYPVMQTWWDEEYYMHRDFDRNYNTNGCLILDTDSVAGVGTKAEGYADGNAPGTNLIIHGHHMASLEMFGALNYYAAASYAEAHPIIYFDTLYERREYLVMAAFYSQVYRRDQEVFKYYNFFQADTQEEFDDWYGNVRRMALYDTGVTAAYGDEFITLSTCEYHVANGRFVVVGKRIS